LTAKLAEHWKYMIQKPKADLSTMVIAPMPGMVKSVVAKVGDEVSQIAHLLKMHSFTNVLRLSMYVVLTY